MWSPLEKTKTRFLLRKMVQIDTLLIVLHVSGALAGCPGKASLFISAPKSITALTGSCLQIPCSIKYETPQVNATGNIYGVWIKNDPRFGNKRDNVIFNSSMAVNAYPMDIVGNLSEMNCTTQFSNLVRSYTDTYFFRVETSSFTGTASCSGLQITVNDSPSKPTMSISGELKEKESVTITCSAPTPCPHSPPRLTWSLQQDAHSQTEENTDRTFTTKIQQNVTLSDQHDGFNLSCSAVYPVDGGERVKTAVAELTLNVSYAPKNMSASISPSGSVSVGSLVNLTCSSRARPAVSYTWFKTSDRGDISVFEGDFYSFNVTEGGVYYCVAANDLGNQTSQRFHLTISTTDFSLHQNNFFGLVIGIILLICLVVCICAIICWKRTKKTNSTVQVGQSSPGEEPAGKEPAGRAEDEGENIHYGEIDFSKRKPEPFSESESSGKREDTLYAEVKASRPPNSSIHTADDPEDLNSLYAVVKKN